MEQVHIIIILLCLIILILLVHSKFNESFIFVKTQPSKFFVDSSLLDLTNELDPYKRGIVYGNLMKEQIKALSKILCPNTDYKNFIRKVFNNNMKYIPVSFLEEIKGLSFGIKDSSIIDVNSDLYDNDIIVINYIFDITAAIKNSGGLSPEIEKLAEPLQSLFFSSSSWTTYNTGVFNANIPNIILPYLITIKRSELILNNDNIRQSLSLTIPGSVGAFACMSYDQNSDMSLFVSCNQVKSLANELFVPGIGIYNLPRFLCYGSINSEDCSNLISSITRGISAIYSIVDSSGNSTVIECLPWNTNDFIFGYNPLKYVPGPAKGFFPSEYRIINETIPDDYSKFGSRKGFFIRKTDYKPTLMTLYMNENFSKQKNKYKAFSFIVPKINNNSIVSNNDFVYPIPRINQIEFDTEDSQQNFDKLSDIDKSQITINTLNIPDTNCNILADLKNNIFNVKINGKIFIFSF